MIAPRLVLSAVALIGQVALAHAQGAFPAPLPGGGQAPAAGPPPMSAGAPPPMSPQGSSFPSTGGGGFSAPAAGGFGAPQQPSAQQSAGAQCQSEFNALKKDAEMKASAISGAGKRKAPPQEACKLLSAFVQSETRMIKYLEVNTQRCGIPPNAADAMKKGHVRTTDLQTKVCAAAANAQKGPPAPSLSEALGSAGAPEARASKGGGSTFDTLNGNVLAR